MRHYLTGVQHLSRWIFLGVFAAICVVPCSSYGANLTENTSARIYPGSATISGSPSINVSSIYTGDDNNDMTVLIEWGVGDFANSYTSASHPASPYIYSITGLDNTQVYQVRVTFQDGDGVTGSSPVTRTGLRPYNQMIHNAVSTGSGTSKWGSGWGPGMTRR